MAAPIELGLMLEGDDARAFAEYLKNPQCTEKGKYALTEARRRYQLRKAGTN
jgi:hypothetical protein